MKILPCAATMLEAFLSIIKLDGNMICLGASCEVSEFVFAAD
jgi:hypothetical protein